MDQVAQAKPELRAARPAEGAALLNADDPLVAAMAGRTAAQAVTFGTSPAAQVRATGIELDRLSRPRFRLTTPDGSATVELRLSGAHNVTNARAAAAPAGALVGGATAVA